MSRYLPIAAALLALPHLLAAASRNDVAARMSRPQLVCERMQGACVARYDEATRARRPGERAGVAATRRYLQP
ncbi:hypothetical protein [Pseudomonas sp. CGJS7]|uniref:hypothetical protein n=1 Tax=Pseudomonas sp. CGJS7 TaxID=3109348 RepID=UPI003007F967